MISRLHAAALVAALALSPCALACGFHDGFGGSPYGMKWQPYNPDANAYGETTTYSSVSADAAAKAAKRTRPSFSNTALRASNSAKSQLDEKKDDTTEDTARNQ